MKQNTAHSWSKLKEIIVEIDGKISYADVTGNTEAKSELVDIKNHLLKLVEPENRGKLTNECRRFHL